MFDEILHWHQREFSFQVEFIRNYYIKIKLIYTNVTKYHCFLIDATNNWFIKHNTLSIIDQ